MTQSDDKYFSSKFARVLSRDDAFCLYHTLTQKKVYGDKSFQTLLEIFQNPVTLNEAKRQLKLGDAPDAATIDRILADMVEIGVIITDKQQDLDTYNHLFGYGVALRDIRQLYLHPSSDCNLRCKYCFIEDEEQRPFVPCQTDIATAIKSVDIFAHLTRGSDEILLYFYGGEPLLNKPVVYETMRYVRELEKQGKFTRAVEMTLQTNGVLVDDETISVAKETNSQVSLSLDGPEAMHDVVRVNLAGGGSFQQALQSYKRLQDAGVNVSPSFNKPCATPTSV